MGKTSTARILAKALNCDSGPQINPCNQCTTCREISSGASMDVIEIDGASNRGIDEIRELRENVRYTPAKGRYKIFIVDEVHMLTREAFNALLKTLEEPPPYIIFIFATTEPHKIPATILSRCQRYDFKRIPLKEVMGSLQRIVEEEKVQISQGGLFSIAQESEGSLRDAQSLLDQVISYGGKEIRDEAIAEVLGIIDRRILHDTIEAIANKNSGRCMEIVEHLYHYGYDLQHFCRGLLQYFRDLILIKVSQQPEGFIELPKEEFDLVRKESEKFQFDQLNHLFSLLLKGEEEIAQTTFPRIMLEMTLIRMVKLPSVLPIDEILKKLETIGKTESSPVKPVVKPIYETLADLEEREPPEERMDEMKPPMPETPMEPKAPPKERGNGGESRKLWEETWKGLMDFSRGKNPVLGSFLALGNLVSMNDDKIEIGFEKDSFHYERMIEKENRSQLDSICQDYFRRKITVIISPLDQGMGSTGRVASEAGETAQNPLVQEALRLFDGKLVER